MKSIQLKHDRRLGYPLTRHLPPIPDEVPGTVGNESTLVTLRPMARESAVDVWDRISACTRFIDFPDRDLAFFEIENDTPLAPLIMWDAAHALPVGRNITVIASDTERTYLERAYFRKCIASKRTDNNTVVFHKHAQLPAEVDSGLNRWTFGIPVGPGDATHLNVVVKQILSIDVPEKEILLCGRPGTNFRYWNDVAIVGEDISAPPVRICAKKNRIAAEARYNNLCIIHDRVYLPRDFLQAIERFGDLFPLLTFQCLYFDDLINLVPRRYSDCGRLERAYSGVKGRIRYSDSFSEFSPATFPELEEMGFVASSPLRYEDGRNYGTGSLYITKRSTWAECPQNESLYWAELEDVEHAMRCCETGIPSRVNPYAFTQSLINRPLLTRAGAVRAEEISGKVRFQRAPTEPLPLPRKPLIKMSYAEANKKLRQFANKYARHLDHTSLPRFVDPLCRQWLEQVYQVVYEAELPAKQKDVSTFIDDFEKAVLLDQLPHSVKKKLVESLIIQNVNAKRGIAEGYFGFANMAAQRRRRRLFFKNPNDYFPRRSSMLGLGTLVSAFVLWYKNGSMFFLPDGYLGYVRAIRNSTPYVVDDKSPQ